AVSFFAAAVADSIFNRGASSRLVLALTFLIDCILLGSYRAWLHQKSNLARARHYRTRKFRIPIEVWVVLTLAAVAWIAYGPALNRVFVDDQIVYLNELHGQTSLAAGLNLYDYAAARRYEKGDDVLFRPLLFVWLAVANHFLSYHHVWWNLATLGLHVL